MKTRLNKSQVVFDGENHIYHLAGVELSGITTLIHDVLGLGCYPNDPFIQAYALPRAAEYGSCVHKAIEVYDLTGLKMTSFPKTRHLPKEDNKESWNVASELESYIKHLESNGCVSLANEFLVSDNERYASCIDNIWQNKETGEIWLVDTKTNNLSTFPGGSREFVQYVTWQLSIYAYLLERQSPEVKVSVLACNWVRGVEAKFIKVIRKPDEQVEKLLATTWSIENGNKVYHPTEGLREELRGKEDTLPVPIIPSGLEITADLVLYVYRVQKQVQEYTQIYENLKAEIRNEMINAGIQKWDSGFFTATCSADTTTKTFDMKAFKADHPELYDQYTKESTRKGAFSLKLN